VPLAQDDWLSTATERREIPVTYRFTRFPKTYPKVPLVDRQRDARREAHQIAHVGQGRRFIEVVHTPDEAPFAVAPRSEVFDVKVADRRQLR
jgi:hypothetical protein